MKLTSSKVCLSLLALSFFACDRENEPVATTPDEVSNATTLLSRSETNTLLALGLNPILEDDLERKEFQILGETISGVAIGDTFIPDNDLKAMTEGSNELGEKAGFASTNRLNLPANGKRLLRIGVVTNGVDAVPQRVRNAVKNAVKRYNNLNMKKLRMQFVPITQAEGRAGRDERGRINIIVFVDANGDFVGNADGRAFFPTNGNPGRLLGLSTATSGYTFKNNSLLIMHELGHTIGMVHSDFLTRRSCGNTRPLNKRLGDLVGIPGINNVCNVRGADSSGDHINSIMQACGFFRWRSATFTAKDKQAFRKLYSQRALPCARKGEAVVLDNTCITDQNEIDYISDNLSDEKIGRLVQLGVLCKN